MFGHCFFVHYLGSVLVCINLAGCFTLFAFQCHLTVSVLCLYLMVPWVGLQCVIVAIPRHVHLLLNVILLSSISKIHAVSAVSKALL